MEQFRSKYGGRQQQSKEESKESQSTRTKHHPHEAKGKENGILYDCRFFLTIYCAESLRKALQAMSKEQRQEYEQKLLEIEQLEVELAARLTRLGDGEGVILMKEHFEGSDAVGNTFEVAAIKMQLQQCINEELANLEAKIAKARGV